MVMFFTHRFLELLCESEDILQDGTFKSSSIFEQIVTIYFVHLKKVFTAQPTYERMLRLLVEHAQLFNLNFNPTRITIDFEGAHSRNPINTSGYHHKRIFFHFNQALFRNIQRLNLASLYNNDEEFRKTIRKFNTIPLLEITQVEEGSRIVKNELIEKYSGNSDIQSFIDYVDRTWMDTDQNHFFKLKVCSRTN